MRGAGGLLWKDGFDKPITKLETQHQDVAWCRMTVVEGWFGGIKYGRVPAAAELHAAELELIEVNAAVNSQVKFTAANGTS